MRLKFGGYQGGSSVHTLGLKTFADALSADAEGFELDAFYDVTAEGMTASALFAGTEDGAFDMCYLASGYLSARVPSLKVLDVPFSVRDRETAFVALDGDVGSTLAIDVTNVTGMKVLGFWDNGFRHLTTGRRPLRSPSDCEGLVIRTLNNQVYQDLLSAFGFKPVVTDVKDLVKSVRDGTVDAQENPLTNLVNFGLDAYHTNVSLTGHIFGVVLLVANGDRYNALSGAERKAVDAAAAAATQAQRLQSSREDEQLLTALSAKGVQVIAPGDLDIAGFKNAAADVMSAALEGVEKDLARSYLQG